MERRASPSGSTDVWRVGVPHPAQTVETPGKLSLIHSMCDNSSRPEDSMKVRYLLLFLTLLPISLPAQPPPETGKPFVVEYYTRLSGAMRMNFCSSSKRT